MSRRETCAIADTVADRGERAQLRALARALIELNRVFVPLVYARDPRDLARLLLR